MRHLFLGPRDSPSWITRNENHLSSLGEASVAACGLPAGAQAPSFVDHDYGIDRHVALQFSFVCIPKYCVLDLGNWKDVEILF